MPMEPKVAIYPHQPQREVLEKLWTNLIRGTKEKNLKVKETGAHDYPDTEKHYKKNTCTSEIVKQITSISIEPGVEIEVTIADA
ncbi:hypothetical protein A6R68_02463 [Neotoma lepida]|uniref:Ribosomal protein S10 domain-containing protein n=1 Tax=Neotoma lepida TaxID=56216 RepID=A0A1A6GS47_NEOLE|nr:hypothetical protein A6R68_02463 [Neotoma lepida]